MVAGISKYLEVAEEPFFPMKYEELHKYGITRIYSPDDGRKMGLEGMIEDVIEKCSPLRDYVPPSETRLPPVGEELGRHSDKNGKLCR